MAMILYSASGDPPPAERWQFLFPRMIGGDASKIVEVSMPGCRKEAIIPGAGHWIQQERPAEINQLLVEFVKSL